MINKHYNSFVFDVTDNDDKERYSLLSCLYEARALTPDGVKVYLYKDSDGWQFAPVCNVDADRYKYITSKKYLQIEFYSCYVCV